VRGDIPLLKGTIRFSLVKVLTYLPSWSLLVHLPGIAFEIPAFLFSTSAKLSFPFCCGERWAKLGNRSFEDGARWF